MADLKNLIKRIQAGDEKAFTELYDEVAPRLKKFFTNPNGKFRLTPQEAEDATQETMLAISNRIPTFDLQGDAEPLTWMLSIALHKGIDQLRKRGDLVRLEDPDAISSPPTEHPKAEGSHPSTGPAMDIFRSLKKPKRDILRHKAHGLSDEQIAEKLGKKPGAVRTQLHRARKEFKDKYEKPVKTP